MKILVTGKNGFIAKNVIEHFLEKNYEVISLSHDDSQEKLEVSCKLCDIIFHLAAVQRTENHNEFYEGNVIYTEKIISALEKHNKKVPIIYSSSIAIENDTVFAKTKKKAEEILREYTKRNNVSVYIYKLNHIFGPYGKPDFNNVIATFCNNIASGHPVIVNDPSIKLQFTYVKDLMLDFGECLRKKCIFENTGYLYTSRKYERSLGEVIMILGKIKNGDKMQDNFQIKLRDTYLSYLNNKDSLK